MTAHTIVEQGETFSGHGPDTWYLIESLCSCGRELAASGSSLHAARVAMLDRFADHEAQVTR